MSLSTGARVDVASRADARSRLLAELAASPARKGYGIAYDLQHGGAYASDRENCLFVAAQYDRAAQCIGWSGPESLEWNNKMTRIACIVSGIADDEASGRSLRALARYHDAKRFKLQIYSTEAGVRRFLNGIAEHLGRPVPAV